MADQRKLSNAGIVRMREALRVFQEELGGLILRKAPPSSGRIAGGLRARRIPRSCRRAQDGAGSGHHAA